MSIGRSIWPAAAGAALLALPGCGGGGGEDAREPTRNVTSIQVQNPFHERLLGLDERIRRVALLRAIRDTGNRCTSVVGGTYQQDHEGMAMWVARCQDDREWAVFIGPNGNVQVRNCAELQQLGLPACRPFEPAEMEPLQPVANSAGQ